MPYATVLEMEALIDDKLWDSTDVNADPTVLEVEGWLDSFSSYVNSRLRPHVAVPIVESDDPEAWDSARDIVMLFTAARLLQRLKFHQAGDENVASDWRAEALQKLDELASGIAETDAGSARTNIRSLEVDPTDADNKLFGMTAIDY